MSQTVLGTFQGGHGDLSNFVFRDTGPERISYTPNVPEKKISVWESLAFFSVTCLLGSDGW